MPRGAVPAPSHRQGGERHHGTTFQSDMKCDEVIRQDLFAKDIIWGGTRNFLDICECMAVKLICRNLVTPNMGSHIVPTHQGTQPAMNIQVRERAAHDQGQSHVGGVRCYPTV